MTELPNNRELEAQILGILLRNNDLLENLSFLNESHFYVPVHQRIFAAIIENYAAGKIASPITLKARFEEDPDLAEVGKAAYLVRCVTLDLRGDAAVGTAKYLVELAQRRTLCEYHRKAAEDILLDTNDLLDHASQSIGFMESIIDGDRDTQTQNGEEIFQEIIADLKTQKKFISTGLRKLDKCMGGGICKGRSYGFAARRKVGKTIMASTISCNLASAGIRHLFIAAEMSPKEIHTRNISRMGKIHSDTFLANPQGITPELQRKLEKAADWQQRNIIYRHAPGLTFDKLRTIVLREIVNKHCKGFILDYWQLVKGCPKGKSTAEYLDDVAQWIADTARKYDVFAICMAQINKEGNTRGSEGLGNAFDQVFQIHREDETLPEAWLQTMVSRHTPAIDIGDKHLPGLRIAGFGPAFEEIA